MTDADAIDAYLPQTQCRRCGYDDCRAYAEAISGGEADIDRCPPGGQHTLRQLSTLLGRNVTTLAEGLEPWDGMRLARIREAECIGCTKCITACPVDAIVGSGKRMHTVITASCTGCRLCLPPCPVDCIDLTPPAAVSGTPWQHISTASASRFRRLRERHRGRQGNPVADRQTTRIVDTDIRADIQRAVARARARRGY